MDQMVDTHQLGDYVKHERERQGLSLRRLAVAAGVDASWLMRLERGEYSSPDPRHLREVARALEVEAADLYALAGYKGGEGLPAFAPYLRAKYDLPPEAIEQLAAHFELISDKYTASSADEGSE
jgi:transcriptional regulator with XRE-family HTH domain